MYSYNSNLEEIILIVMDFMVYRLLRLPVLSITGFDINMEQHHPVTHGQTSTLTKLND